MELTELPLNLPGKIYRSGMPFSSYDPKGALIQTYKKIGVSMVVMLVDEEECLRITGHDLKAIYKRENFKVIYLPIPDFGTPVAEGFGQAISEVVEHARTSGKAAIHCHAGKGRTGMFAACLAKRELGYSSDQAIHWVKELIPGAVEVPEQEQFVRSY